MWGQAGTKGNIQNSTYQKRFTHLKPLHSTIVEPNRIFTLKILYKTRNRVPRELTQVLLVSKHLRIIEGVDKREALLPDESISLIGSLVVVDPVQPDAHRRASVITHRVYLHQNGTIATYIYIYINIRGKRGTYIIWKKLHFPTRKILGSFLHHQNISRGSCRSRHFSKTPSTSNAFPPSPPK